jgi:hypothetical protein
MSDIVQLRCVKLARAHRSCDLTQWLGLAKCRRTAPAQTNGVDFAGWLARNNSEAQKRRRRASTRSPTLLRHDGAGANRATPIIIRSGAGTCQSTYLEIGAARFRLRQGFRQTRRSSLRERRGALLRPAVAKQKVLAQFSKTFDATSRLFCSVSKPLRRSLKADSATKRRLRCSANVAWL